MSEAEINVPIALSAFRDKQRDRARKGRKKGNTHTKITLSVCVTGAPLDPTLTLHLSPQSQDRTNQGEVEKKKGKKAHKVHVCH